MGTFKTVKTLYASPALIPVMAEEIAVSFRNDGFEVKCDELISGGYDLSVAKGGMLKSVLGMKSALKINIQPSGDRAILIEAGVGIFGQQAVPTLISMFVTWPVLITQIWGMVRQSKLDDRAIEIAQACIMRHHAQSVGGMTGGTTAVSATATDGKFCTSCGSRQSAEAQFCSQCGAKLG